MLEKLKNGKSRDKCVCGNLGHQAKDCCRNRQVDDRK